MPTVLGIVVFATIAVAVALGGLCRANFAAIDLHTRNRQAAEGRRHPLPPAQHEATLTTIHRRIVRWGTVGTAGLFAIAVAAAAASVRSMPPAWVTATIAASAALVGAFAGRWVGRAYATTLTRSQRAE